MQVICLHKTRALSTANAAFAEAIAPPPHDDRCAHVILSTAKPGSAKRKARRSYESRRRTPFAAVSLYIRFGFMQIFPN